MIGSDSGSENVSAGTENSKAIPLDTVWSCSGLSSEGGWFAFTVIVKVSLVAATPACGSFALTVTSSVPAAVLSGGVPESVPVASSTLSHDAAGVTEYVIVSASPSGSENASAGTVHEKA